MKNLYRIADTKQTEKGVPEIKPGISKSDIGRRFRYEGPVQKKYVTNPNEIWESLARETERELREVETTGQEIEKPTIHKSALVNRAVKEVYAKEYFKGWSEERIKNTWKSYGADFDKCVEKAKSWAESPEGFCAALEEAATGKWPREE